MDRKSFIIHIDSLGVLDALTDAQAGKLFKAIKAYQVSLLCGEVKDTTQDERQDTEVAFDALMSDAIVKVAFYPFKSQFDRDAEKYETISERRREAGKKGVLAKQANAINCQQMPANDFSAKQTEHNKNKSKNDSKNDSDIKKEIKEKGETAKRFTPPSLNDLSNFISENKYTIDPQAFYHFYESKGWMVGKNKMKDWKAAVRAWQQKDKDSHNIAPPGREYTYEEMCTLTIDQRKYKQEDFEIVPRTDGRKPNWRLKQPQNNRL